MKTYKVYLTMVATYEYEIETEHEPETDEFNDAVDDGWAALPYVDMETSEITIDKVEEVKVRRHLTEAGR